MTQFKGFNIDKQIIFEIEIIGKSKSKTNICMTILEIVTSRFFVCYRANYDYLLGYNELFIVTIYTLNN